MLSYYMPMVMIYIGNSIPLHVHTVLCTEPVQQLLWIMVHLPIVFIFIAFLMIVPQSNGAEKL